jgi:iron complex outermembrane receptor protein
MKKKYFSAFFCSLIVNAQQNKQKTDTLQEVVITSSRIDLPFKEPEPFS